MKAITTFFKQLSHDFFSDIYTLQITKLLSKKLYSKIPLALDTFPKYSKVQIQSSPLIIHLIQTNNTECLDQLLSTVNYKQEIYKSQSDDLKTLPLFLACMNNQQEVIEVFLKNGAKIDEVNSLNQNLLHLSAINISKHGIDVGLKHKVSANLLDSFANLPLHYAARSGNLPIVKQLLIATTAKYSKNLFNFYPLHLAVESASLETTKLFMKDLKLLDTQSTNPLILATHQSNPDIVSLLLQQKQSLARQADDNNMLPLHHAAMQGNQEGIRMLSKFTDIDVADTMGHTPLHLAVLEGKLDAVKVLRELGADSRRVNVDGLNCLDLARHAKNDEIRRYLELYGKGLD